MPKSDYHSRRLATDPEYRERKRLASRKWRLENPERVKRQKRVAQLRKYGLTIEQFEAMVGRGCYICGTASGDASRPLAVDHCHTSGVVRGLLCGRCNRAVGLMLDSPELLRKAADYLENDDTSVL